MENNFGDNSLEYWASIPKVYQDSVYNLRKYSNIKIAFESEIIWLRSLTKSNIESLNILKIPSIKRFYLKETHLIEYGKSLPFMIEPTLLWTPIQRGLKIKMPKENFNYFGLDSSFNITIEPSSVPQKITASIVNLDSLEKYLETYLNYRTKTITWTILNKTTALLLGSPLIPIPGKDYYQADSFIIPAGWKLTHECLLLTFKKALKDELEYWYLIDENSHINKIKKSDFTPLNKGSFLKSINDET